MSAVEQQPVILHADQEHGGIRLVIFLALFLAYFIGFQIVAGILRALAPDPLRDYTTFLSCIGALPLAVVMIWALEQALKRVWHSGLSLALDGRGITIHDRRRLPDGVRPPEGDGQPAIVWAGNLTQLNWYFKLSGYPRGGRERRVSAKWLCLATELHQDGARLNVFTFMPPGEAGLWIDNPRDAFHRLNPVEIYDSSMRSRLGPPNRPAIPTHLLHTKDGRYWLAERRRWEYGVELTPRDFAILMNYARAGMQPAGATGKDPRPMPNV